MGTCFHSIARSTLAAAAFMTFTHSGTTSSPISSPSSMPSLNILHAPLIGLDAERLDELGPLDHIAVHDVGELLPREHPHVEALLGELVRNLGIGEHFVDCIVH